MIAYHQTRRGRAEARQRRLHDLGQVILGIFLFWAYAALAVVAMTICLEN